MITYWLWKEGEVVTAVRGQAGMSRQDVVSKALEWHWRVPICDRPLENPIDRANRILRSEVRTYANGR